MTKSAPTPDLSTYPDDPKLARVIKDWVDLAEILKVELEMPAPFPSAASPEDQVAWLTNVMLVIQFMALDLANSLLARSPRVDLAMVHFAVNASWTAGEARRGFLGDKSVTAWRKATTLTAQLTPGLWVAARGLIANVVPPPCAAGPEIKPTMP